MIIMIIKIMMMIATCDNTTTLTILLIHRCNNITIAPVCPVDGLPRTLLTASLVTLSPFPHLCIQTSSPIPLSLWSFWKHISHLHQTSSPSALLPPSSSPLARSAPLLPYANADATNVFLPGLSKEVELK